MSTLPLLLLLFSVCKIFRGDFFCGKPLTTYEHKERLLCNFYSDFPLRKAASPPTSFYECHPRWTPTWNCIFTKFMRHHNEDDAQTECTLVHCTFRTIFMRAFFPRSAWHLFVLVLSAIHWYTCTGCNRLEYLSFSPFSRAVGSVTRYINHFFSISSPESFAPCIVHQATAAQKSTIANDFWFGFMKRHEHYFGHCFVLLSMNFSFVVLLRLILMLNSPPMNSWRSIRSSEYCCWIFQMLQESVRGQLISPWELFMVSHSNEKKTLKNCIMFGQSCFDCQTSTSPNPSLEPPQTTCHSNLSRSHRSTVVGPNALVHIILTIVQS